MRNCFENGDPVDELGRRQGRAERDAGRRRPGPATARRDGPEEASSSGRQAVAAVAFSPARETEQSDVDGVESGRRRQREPAQFDGQLADRRRRRPSRNDPFRRPVARLGRPGPVQQPVAGVVAVVAFESRTASR